MKLRWTVSVDLDGILAQPTSIENYSAAKPIRENIDKVNRLYDKGWSVCINTSRGWYYYDITSGWLLRQGVKYHQLVMGKFLAHVYVDDLNGTLDEALVKEI